MSIFANEGQVKTALEDLRNDASQTNWVAFGYAGSSENVELVGTGSNGITGVLEHFKDDVNAYAVLGITVTEEAAQFTKYIFISWVGPSVKPLHKGRSSQHRLPIYKFCNTIVQLAGEYQALTLEDVTEEKLKQKLSGSKHTEGEAASDVLKAKGAGASEKFQFEDEASFKSELQELQKGKINWILLGYDHGREEAVKILGKGEGDLNDFAGKLSDDDVAYIIYGQKIAEAGDFVTVKYISITWVGPNVKPLHRARSSQHRVQIYNFSKKEVQLAGEIQILNKSELTEQGLVEKLSGTFTVGAKSEEELRAAAEADAKKKQGSAQAKPKAKEEDVKSPLSDEAGVKPILEDLGKPDSPTNWVAFGYDKDNKNQSVNFLQKGTGNLDEIHALLNEDAVVYVVLGHIQDEGDYSTLKFLFITFVGPKVKPMVKARSSQHRVLLYNFVNKTVTLHGELQILNKEELTLGLLNEKITGSRHVAGESSGKAQAAVEQARQTAGARKGVAASKDQFTWSNEEEAKNKIIDVRSNKANWVAFGHKSNDVLQVIGSGNGSLDELKVHFKDEDIVYAVLSVVAGESECEGDYKLNKFVFISWVGPEVKPLVKARSSQHRVALYNFVKPILALHGELQFLSQADVSMDVIRKKIGDTQ